MSHIDTKKSDDYSLLETSDQVIRVKLPLTKFEFRSASGEMAVDGVTGADADVDDILFIGGLLRTSLDEKSEAFLATLRPRAVQFVHVSS